MHVYLEIVKEKASALLGATDKLDGKVNVKVLTIVNVLTFI